MEAGDLQSTGSYRLLVLVIKKLSTSNPFLWESQSVITIWVEGALMCTATYSRSKRRPLNSIQNSDIPSLPNTERHRREAPMDESNRGFRPAGFQRAKDHRCLQQRAASCKCLVGRHWERRWQQQIFWVWGLLGEAVCWRQGWSGNSLLVSGRDIQATEPEWTRYVLCLSKLWNSYELIGQRERERRNMYRLKSTEVAKNYNVAQNECSLINWRNMKRASAVAQDLPVGHAMCCSPAVFFATSQLTLTVQTNLGILRWLIRDF